VKADDKTVAKVRRELESTVEIPQLEKTTGADGKERPTKRKVAEQKVFDSSQAAHGQKFDPVDFMTGGAMTSVDIDGGADPEKKKRRTAAEITRDNFLHGLVVLQHAAETFANGLDNVDRSQITAPYADTSTKSFLRSPTASPALFPKD
jgi:hypothetical protein